MSVSENFKLEGESLSFEGKVTSVTVTNTGGTLNVSGKAGIYGSVYLTYNLTLNPNVKNQGSVTGNAVAFADDGQRNTAALQGVWTRDGHTIKMYTIDDVSDGNFHVAIVIVDLRSESASIEFSRLQK